MGQGRLAEVGEADLEEQKGLLEEGGERVVLGLRDVLLRDVGHAPLEKVLRHSADFKSRGSQSYDGHKSDFEKSVIFEGGEAGTKS